MMIMGKNSAIFSKIGKVYLFNWDFSVNNNWECSRSIGNFSANWEKNWNRKLDPVLYREKALSPIRKLNELKFLFIFVES